MDLVSIIIPAYNHASLLPGAIESCLAQTYPSIEIIVVDDGSTDNTQIVATRYPQVRYIHQSNKGPATARNTGWRQSNGTFVQFLDADDILLPTKIERCMAVFDAHSEIGVVCTASEVRSTDLKESYPTGRLPWSGPEERDLRSLITRTGPFFAPHDPLIRRKWLERVGGFDESLRHADDWMLWVSLMAHGATFYRVKEALAIHRTVPNSYSSHTLDMARERVRIAEKFRALPIPREIVDLDTVIADRHHILALKLWRHGKRAEARQHFRQAIALVPRGRYMRRALILCSYVVPADAALTALNRVLFLRRLRHTADDVRHT